MLDRNRLPRSFSVPYGDASFDFVVTNASDENSLILNVAGGTAESRSQFPNALQIDRHAGTFDWSEDLRRHLDALRPVAMKVNAIPAKVLGVVWRIVGGILGSGPRTFFIGGGEVGLAWNLMMLGILIALIALAATIGIYVVAPLLVIAVLCFVLDAANFQPNEAQRAKAFTESVAGNVRDLVEDTVVF